MVELYVYVVCGYFVDDFDVVCDFWCECDDVDWCD